jgi:hypothetical protein
VVTISMLFFEKRSKALLDRIERAMGKALNREPVRKEHATPDEFEVEAKQAQVA